MGIIADFKDKIDLENEEVDEWNNELDSDDSSWKVRRATIHLI